MKNYIKYIICSLSLICFGTSFAQDLSWGEQRRFRLCIYTAMENYEMYSSLYDDNYRAGFASLFKYNDLEIYNDLLGVSTAASLSVNDYIRIVEKKADNIDVKIRNINVGEFYWKDDSWHVDVKFDKEMKYFNAGGLMLSSKLYYGVDYNMAATFVLEQEEGEEGEDEYVARIISLKGEMNSEKAPLPENYFAVSRSKIKEKSGAEYYDPRDLDASWNGNKFDFMEFSEMSYAFVPESIDKVKFAYPRDNDISVKHVPVSAYQNLYYLKYKPTHWRTKLQYEFSLLDHYNIKLTDERVKTESSSQEFGVDFGYIFPSASIFKTGLFLGVGAAMNKIKMELESSDYIVSTNGKADIDGDRYDRYYSLKNISQEFSTMDLVIPLYLEFDIRFSKWVSMYVDLGAKAYLNMTSKIDSYSAEYSTYGVYPDYDNLVLDERSGINGFTNRGVLNESNLVNEFKPNVFSIDAFGSLGFRATLAKMLQLTCGVSYQYGLNNYISSFAEEQQLSFDGKVTMDKAFVNYTVSDNKENVRNMVDAATSFRRQSLKLNVGLILKF